MGKNVIAGLRKNDNAVLFAKFFIATIAVHWFFMLLGYIVMKYVNNPDASFFSYYYDKFIGAGDTPHYIHIAEHGYVSSGDKVNLIVFYPLFPFLMKVFSFIFQDYFVSGVFVSNVCLGVSGYYMYKLCDRELGYKKAQESWVLYVLYPTGAFMVGVFTESLFVMLALMCLYYIRDKKWILAGVLGMLASFSKSQGIALLVPAVYEVIVHAVRNKKYDFKMSGVLLIPFGTLAYLIINKIVLGDFLAFVQHQAAEPWYNVSHWISDNITQHYGMGMDDGYFALGIIIYWAQLILYFVGIIALFYGIKKKIRTSYIAFGGAYMFLSYLHGWLISGPRYMMSCLTLYLIYGAIDNKVVKQVILVFAAVMMVFFTHGIWYGEPIM